MSLTNIWNARATAKPRTAVGVISIFHYLTKFQIDCLVLHQVFQLCLACIGWVRGRGQVRRLSQSPACAKRRWISVRSQRREVSAVMGVSLRVVMKNTSSTKAPIVAILAL